MNGLIKIKDFEFGALLCDVYGDGKGDFFITREQIGKALEYDNPQKAIDKIHERHKERLDKLSVTVRLGATDNKQYDTCLYTAKGIYEICRWSRQPKADIFYDNVYEILEGLRLGYLKLKAEKQSPHWQETRLESKKSRRLETDAIKTFIAYAEGQGSKNAVRYYGNLSRLANNAVGTVSGVRDETEAKKLNILALVEDILSRIIYQGINENLYYKDIFKACKEQIVQFTMIACLGME